MRDAPTPADSVWGMTRRRYKLVNMIASVFKIVFHIIPLHSAYHTRVIVRQGVLDLNHFLLQRVRQFERNARSKQLACTQPLPAPQSDSEEDEDEEKIKKDKKQKHKEKESEEAHKDQGNKVCACAQYRSKKMDLI